MLILKLLGLLFICSNVFASSEILDEYNYSKERTIRHTVSIEIFQAGGGTGIDLIPDNNSNVGSDKGNDVDSNIDSEGKIITIPQMSIPAEAEFLLGIKKGVASDLNGAPTTPVAKKGNQPVLKPIITLSLSSNRLASNALRKFMSENGYKNLVWNASWDCKIRTKTTFTGETFAVVLAKFLQQISLSAKILESSSEVIVYPSYRQSNVCLPADSFAILKGKGKKL